MLRLQQSPSFWPFVGQFSMFALIAFRASYHDIVDIVRSAARKRHDVVNMPLVTFYLFVAIIATALLALQLCNLISVGMGSFGISLTRTPMTTVLQDFCLVISSPLFIPITDTFWPKDAIVSLIFDYRFAIGHVSFVIVSAFMVAIAVVPFSTFYAVIILVFDIMLLTILLTCGLMFIVTCPLSPCIFFGMIQSPLSFSRFITFNTNGISAKRAILIGSEFLKLTLFATDTANFSWGFHSVSLSLSHKCLSADGVSNRFSGLDSLADYPNYTAVVGVFQ